MKKVINWTQEELAYIKKLAPTDQSANVFCQPSEDNKYKVYAKPFGDSKSSFKFVTKNEISAQKMVPMLLDESIGYSFEVRGKRVLAKPTTQKATLTILCEDKHFAIKMVEYLRAQEIVNRRNAEKRRAQNQGTRLIRTMIAPTEAELYESLYNAIEDTIESDSVAYVDDLPFTDLLSAKTHIAQTDFKKEVDKASQKLCDTLISYQRQ